MAFMPYFFAYHALFLVIFQFMPVGNTLAECCFITVCFGIILHEEKSILYFPIWYKFCCRTCADWLCIMVWRSVFHEFRESFIILQRRKSLKRDLICPKRIKLSVRSSSTGDRELSSYFSSSVHPARIIAGGVFIMFPL